MQTECNIYLTIDLISKRWAMPILLDIFHSSDSTKRFSEIKDGIDDLSSKVLSERLRELNSFGMIERMVDDSIVPNKVEYRLTEKGKQLIDIFQDIKDWAVRWDMDKVECDHFPR